MLSDIEKLVEETHNDLALVRCSPANSNQYLEFHASREETDGDIIRPASRLSFKHPMEVDADGVHMIDLMAEDDFDDDFPVSLLEKLTIAGGEYFSFTGDDFLNEKLDTLSELESKIVPYDGSEESQYSGHLPIMFTLVDEDSVDNEETFVYKAQTPVDQLRGRSSVRCSTDPTRRHGKYFEFSPLRGFEWGNDDRFDSEEKCDDVVSNDASPYRSRMVSASPPRTTPDDTLGVLASVVNKKWRFPLRRHSPRSELRIRYQKTIISAVFGRT